MISLVNDQTFRTVLPAAGAAGAAGASVAAAGAAGASVAAAGAAGAAGASVAAAGAQAPSSMAATIKTENSTDKRFMVLFLLQEWLDRKSLVLPSNTTLSSHHLLAFSISSGSALNPGLAESESERSLRLLCPA
jgi:hypothetical protein